MQMRQRTPPSEVLAFWGRNGSGFPSTHARKSGGGVHNGKKVPGGRGAFRRPLVLPAAGTSKGDTRCCGGRQEVSADAVPPVAVQTQTCASGGQQAPVRGPSGGCYTGVCALPSAPGTPFIGWGSRQKKRVEWDQGLNRRPVAARGQPGTPPPRKKKSPGTGMGTGQTLFRRGGGSVGSQTHPPKKIVTQNLAEGNSNLNKRPLCGTDPDPPPS